MTAPPLPSLRALAAELRDLHGAWSHPDAGGEYAALWFEKVEDWHIDRPGRWRVRAINYYSFSEVLGPFGREYIPGDGAPFDATAAARRLLAAARDADYR